MEHEERSAIAEPDGTRGEGRIDKLLSRAFSLSPIEYDLQRGELAKQIGCRVTTLDAERQRHIESSAAEGATDDDLASEMGWDIDPWPEPVSGAALLNEIRDELTRFLSVDDHAKTVVPLWVVFTHAIRHFDISPMLFVTSPEPECGKTTLLEWLEMLCHQVLNISSVTAATIYRIVDRFGCCLLLDEVDAYMRDDNPMRGIINGSHRRKGAKVPRCEGDANEIRFFNSFGAKALSGIGSQHPTIVSRAIPVEMRRALERLPRWEPEDEERLAEIKRRIARWVADNRAGFRESRPDVPAELGHRQADNWRPLTAIADLAGSDWPERARESALALAAKSSQESLRTILLGDIQRIFQKHGSPLSSQMICDDLVRMEDRPWAEWGRREQPLSKTRWRDC